MTSSAVLRERLRDFGSVLLRGLENRRSSLENAAFEQDFVQNVFFILF